MRALPKKKKRKNLYTTHDRDTGLVRFGTSERKVPTPARGGAMKTMITYMPTPRRQTFETAIIARELWRDAGKKIIPAFSLFF
jgi:hypothetical protein